MILHPQMMLILEQIISLPVAWNSIYGTPRHLRDFSRQNTGPRID
jgi:hypothetical protein